MSLNEVSKSLINSVNEFPAEFKGRILKIALAVNQPDVSTDYSKIIDKFSVSSGIPKDHLLEVLSVYIAIVRLFLQSNEKEFVEKMNDIGFSRDFIDNLPLIPNRHEVFNNFQNCSFGHFGKINFFKWRVDISLGNSTLMKKVPVGVTLCITLKNGNKYTIDVEAKLFHKLRFNVAFVLKEIELLKSNMLNK